MTSQAHNNLPSSGEPGEDIKSQNALLLSDAKFSGILSIAIDAIISIDESQNIILFNEGAETIFGYSRDEIIGKPLDILIPEKFRFAHRSNIRDFGESPTIARRMGERREIFGLRKNGEEFPAEASISKLETNGERIFNVVLRDVTDRKRIEQELRKAHDELEKRVQERTAELARANETLQEEIAERKRIEMERERLLISERAARAQAEAANRMKDEFLATVSHELRTPLNAILGWATMLSDGKLDGAAFARATDTIRRNARSQAQIIDDLLDVSRIISGKLNLQMRQVELIPVINAAIDSIRPAAEAKGIKLQTIFDHDTGLVSGDPDRLQQILWNLLSNAIKFSSKGSRVRVYLESVNSQLEIRISDTGQGISPEFLPYVFDRFRQADGSTTRNHGGLGLGLAIARNLIELHGGEIFAASKGIGQGATFTVKLPVRAVNGEIDDSFFAELQPDVKTTADAKNSSLTGLKVLVVDDEADARDLVATVLNATGAEPTTAGSTAEALQQLKKFKPDILVSDIGMPGEDGYVLIKKVRKLTPEQGGQIPAVALTAYARVEDRMRVLSEGFQMHVPKPVEPKELVSVIANLTGRD